VLDSLILAIQFYNCYADEPIANREEAFSKFDKITLPNKITQAVWPG
jgi:hypothetical protein